MAKILMFKTESKRVIGRQVVRFINFIKWGLGGENLFGVYDDFM